MKPLYRNIFFLLGLGAVAVMLLTFEMDYVSLWAHVRRAGWWFGAVVGVWVVIYLLNALSWAVIINSRPKQEDQDAPSPSPSFWFIYKLTITGFALNYATPCGLMGGEPYRIMELKPIIGAQRAASSVILYVMMHIFSHICFWLCSTLLYIIMYGLEMAMLPLLGMIVLFCVAAIYFFMRGYRYGMLVRTLRWIGRIPLVGRWALGFLDRKGEQLKQIDEQVAALHSCHRGAFYRSFAAEFVGRVLTSAEIFFIMLILTSEVNFFDCVLIMAFTSLFGNIFFFSPMQLGAREGGFALSVSALSISSGFGVYTALITRLREIIWILIGLLLMRVGNGISGAKKAAKFTERVKNV